MSVVNAVLPSARAGGHPLLSMCLAMLLVGATAALGEVALAGMPLPWVLALRLALAWGLLEAASTGRRVRLRPVHWLVLAVQALCGVVVFNAGLWLGMETSGPAAAGVFTSATPALMVLIGVLFFGERPTLRALGGVGLCVAGVLAARGGSGQGWSPQPSDAWLLAAVVGEAVFLLALKWLPAHLTPLDAARRITLLGFLLVSPWALCTPGGMQAFGAAPLSSWLAVAALGVLVTAGGYVLWFRGVGRVSASVAAVVTGLMPVSAVLASWLLLGARPDAGQALGCLAVGLGIGLATKK